MAKIKKVTWAQKDVATTRVAEFLTMFNYQPGKFLAVPSVNTGYTTIIWVAEEKD